MRQYAFSAFWLTTTCVLQACSSSPETQNADYEVNHSDPAAVVQAVFDVAQGANPSILSTLCDPKRENDLDTRRICDLSEGVDPEGEFARYFADARITGEAVIRGDTAFVPFEFGPKPPRPDEMLLIRRGSSWHLFSF